MELNAHWMDSAHERPEGADHGSRIECPLDGHLTAARGAGAVGTGAARSCRNGRGGWGYVVGSAWGVELSANWTTASDGSGGVGGGGGRMGELN